MGIDDGGYVQAGGSSGGAVRTDDGGHTRVTSSQCEPCGTAKFRAGQAAGGRNLPTDWALLRASPASRWISSGTRSVEPPFAASRPLSSRSRSPPAVGDRASSEVRSRGCIHCGRESSHCPTNC